MLVVEIARPPGDIRGLPREVDRVLAGPAAGFQHVTGFPGKVALQDRPDRLVVAMECGCVQPAVRLDRPPVLAKLDHIFRHQRLRSRAHGTHPAWGALRQHFNPSPNGYLFIAFHWALCF